MTIDDQNLPKLAKEVQRRLALSPDLDEDIYDEEPLGKDESRDFIEFEDDYLERDRAWQEYRLTRRFITLHTCGTYRRSCERVCYGQMQKGSNWT